MSKVTSRKEQQPQSFVSGTPPWHTIILVLLLVFIGIRAWPSSQDIDQVATLNTFSKRLFPSILTLSALAIIRACCSIFIFTLSLQYMYYTWRYEPTVITTTYPANSKLKHHQRIELRGIRSMYFFTMWAWNLLGLSCGLNAYLAYCAWRQQQTSGTSSTPPAPQWMLRIGILLFEVASPTALLVSCVVRYAIWPQLLRRGKGRDPTAVLKYKRTLAFHNMNTIIALSEVALLGGLPVRYSDFSVTLALGGSYILFSWSMMHRWNRKAGPQFLYHFFDTTQGIMTSVYIIILLMVLITFYALFCGLHHLLDHMGGGVSAHFTAVFVLSSLVCRFRD